MKSYSERLIEWCNKTIEIFEWDFEAEQKEWEEKKSRRIYANEGLKKIIQKSKAEAELNYGRGIAAIYDRIPTPRSYGVGWVDYIGYRTHEDFTVENIEDQKNYALHIKDLIDLYNDWQENEFKAVIQNIAGQNRFDDPEFTMNPSILEDVNDLVNKGHFKIYTYRDGGHKIKADDTFYISTLVGISEDLTMWLNHVEHQQEFLSKQSEDEIFVTMFGKLDYIHPLYSSWVLTFHKGDTIWLVSDAADFDNPYQKHHRLGRKSVWRDAEAKWDLCNLPYDIFFNLDELRKSNTGVMRSDNRHNLGIKEEYDGIWFSEGKKKYALVVDSVKLKLDQLHIEYDVVYAEDTSSGSMRSEYHVCYAKKNGATVGYWEYESDDLVVHTTPEVLFKDFRELPDGQKAFTMLLVNELIQWATSINLEMPTVLLSNQFINTKLLESATCDPDGEESRMSYWEEPAKAIFQELVETLKDQEEEPEEITALALRSYEIVTRSKEYDNSWLSTYDKLESLSEWIVLEEERKKLDPLIRKLAGRKDEANQWLEDTLNKNYDAIIKRVCQAQEIEFVTDPVSQFGSWRSENEKKNPDERRAGHIIVYNPEKKSVYDKRGKGAGKTKYSEEYCVRCGDYESKIVAKVHIRYYKGLMWLFGFEKREQLHPYFRQFRAHDLIPYSGNSLLDQTHPYLRAYDPASRRSNGFTIDVFMCGHCWRKIKPKKEHIKIRL